MPTHEAVRSKGGIFSLDDSLCSTGVPENKNLSHNSGDSVQDGLSGSNATVSPGEPLHQETQTHTVLSFCSEASTPAAVPSELKKELSAAIGKFQIIEYNEPKDDITVDCSDSEDEAMEPGNLKEPEVSKFQCKNKPVTCRYDFGKILPRFKSQRGKKGSKNCSNTKMRTKKRVTLGLVVDQGGFSEVLQVLLYLVQVIMIQQPRGT